jgi:high-affinity iron transporter
MNEFIIMFREGLEASLIVGIIYTLLIKQELNREIRQLWLGVGAAIFASIITGFALVQVKSSIGNASIEALFEGVAMIATAGLIWYVIFWLSKQVGATAALKDEANQAVESAGWGIFLIIFFAIFREGFETAIFLMGSFSMTESFSYSGFIGGLALAIAIGYAIVIQGKRIQLKSFFRATSLLLVVFATGMMTYGAHEIEEFFVKGDHLQVIGLETKQDISRPYSILKPKTELSESDNPAFYSYNLNGKENTLTYCMIRGILVFFLKDFWATTVTPTG